MKVGIFDYHTVTPLKQFGLTGNFWTIHLDTLIYTWAAMIALLIFALVGRRFIYRDVNYVSIAYEKMIEPFINLCEESFTSFNYGYFAFVTSLFFFTLFSCVIGVLPFLDEATKDLNTTFALGLTSFVYVQVQKIRVHGILGYCKEFMHPFFLLAPINIVGELAKIASMSFRLFGNILGGGIIFSMIINYLEQYAFYFIGYLGVVILAMFFVKRTPLGTKYPWIETIASYSMFVAFLLTWLQMFFGIFEGMIQSFVLTMLTLTYLSMGVTKEDSPEEVAS